MWDLKLLIITFLNFEYFFIYNWLFSFYDLFEVLSQKGLIIDNWKNYYNFNQNMTFFFAIKFLICIAFLILIRGGTPRYRYDYLTKLGWLKFISFILFSFFFYIYMFILY